MRRLSGLIGILAILGLAGPVGACGDPRTAVPTSPSPPGVESIDIMGPGTVAPGQTVRFAAMVRLSDGTVKATSPDTSPQWFSSNPGVLLVTAAGVATAVQMGEAILTVRLGALGGRQASREVVVLPDGTYRMVGTVSEAESPDFLVYGARVEVTPGPVVTTTDFGGRYRLYGVPANAVLQVSKEGYATVTKALQLSSHVTQDVQLTLTGRRIETPGHYLLVIDATEACGGGNPISADLRRLAYDAVLTQSGAEVSVALTESRFRVNSINRGNAFNGYADAAGVQFVLDPFDLYYYPYYGPTAYPNIVERLPNGTYLVPQGTVLTTRSAEGLSGVMDGFIANYDATFPSGFSTLLGYCSSKSIRFTLTPR